VIPPKEWVPRRSGYGNIASTIPAPIKQMMNGSKGLYQLYNVQQKPMSTSEFAALATSDVYDMKIIYSVSVDSSDGQILIFARYTGYKYPTYNIQPDPDFCWLTFFFHIIIAFNFVIYLPTTSVSVEFIPV